MIFKLPNRGERRRNSQNDSTRSEAAKWIVLSKPFEKWGYTLLAAYPQADVAAKLRVIQAIVICCVLVVSLLVVLAQYAC